MTLFKFHRLLCKYKGSLLSTGTDIYSSLSDISLGHLAFEKKVFPSKTAY